jgi:hypothetical protein
MAKRSKRKKRGMQDAAAADRAARRTAALEAGGTGLWRPRSARFPDRKKERSRRQCRGNADG